MPTSGGGDGLISTADDYLKFARMLMNGGAADGVRLLKPESVGLLTSDRLTPAQHAEPFLGMPFWKGQGFGLGVAMITDAKANAWMGPGAEGAYGWPGVFGTWWRADPRNNLILIYMAQNATSLEPGPAQPPTGRRLMAQAALPTFQNLAYQTLAG